MFLQKAVLRAKKTKSHENKDAKYSAIHATNETQRQANKHTLLVQVRLVLPLVSWRQTRNPTVHEGSVQVPSRELDTDDESKTTRATRGRAASQAVHGEFVSSTSWWIEEEKKSPKGNLSGIWSFCYRNFSARAMMDNSPPMERQSA